VDDWPGDLIANPLDNGAQICAYGLGNKEQNMANMKYFADLVDGSTLEFANVDYRSRKDIRGYDPASKQWLQCNRTVEYKRQPSRHECDERCMGATGLIMKCECRCGGKNHGKGPFRAEAA
jgi:hypothetical protein